jgi:cytochrome c biogenesis protein ResB
MLLLGLGVLLLVSGVLVFIVRTNIADGVVAAGRDAGSALLSRSDLVRSLAVVAAIFVATGVVSLIVGYYVRRRQSWARFVGIGVGVLLGVLSVQFLLAAGGGFVALLLPVGAIGVAVTIVATLLSSPTATWFRGEQAR